MNIENVRGRVYSTSSPTVLTVLNLRFYFVRREFEHEEEALIDMWNRGWDAVEGNGTNILAWVRYIRNENRKCKGWRVYSGGAPTVLTVLNLRF